MKIQRVAVHRVDFRLRQPYTIAYETIERVTNFLVEVDAGGGLVGLGCGSPAEDVTGEGDADCALALERAADLLCGRAIEPPDLPSEIVEPLANTPAARAALDTATWDLAGKVAARPVHALLGGRAGGRATSVTIGICGLDEAVAAAVGYARAGFRALKIKGGHDVEADVERIRRIRDAVGDAVTLRFDANQGYGVDAALRFARAVRGYVELIEQPLPAGADDEMVALRRRIGADGPALMVDESLIGIADATRLIARRGADLFNVKLMKAGSIGRALGIARAGHSAGIETMISCMDEAALGIAAGLHVALASPGVTRVDLDGHLDLIDDPTTAALRLENGMLYPADSPGFGVSHRALNALR